MIVVAALIVADYSSPAYDVSAEHGSSDLVLIGRYQNDGVLRYTGIVWKRGGPPISLVIKRRSIDLNSLDQKMLQDLIDEGDLDQWEGQRGTVVSTGFVRLENGHQLYIRTEFIGSNVQLVRCNYGTMDSNKSFKAFDVIVDGMGEFDVPCPSRDAEKVLGPPTKVSRELRF